MNTTGKLLCILLAVAVLCTCVPGAFAQGSQQISQGDFTYSISAGEATVTAYTGSGQTVTVPATVQGYPVTAIADSAFERKPFRAVTLSEGLRSIGQEAFLNCHQLESISLPASLVSIGEMAFENCFALKTVTVPKNVQSIGASAFSNCTGLQSLQVVGENPYFSSQDSVIFSKDGKTLLYCYNFTDTAYTVPAQVQVIGEKAFANHGNLRQVTLPAGLKTIQKYAFSGCTALESIALPDSVTSVDIFAFRGCSSLGEVTLGAGMQTVSAYSFSNCPALNSVTLAEGTKTIADRAFSGCGTVEMFTVPDSLTSIASGAFNGTTLTAVRFYSTRQKEALEGKFSGSRTLCLCRGEHTYTAQQPDECSVCGYSRNLKTPPTFLSKTHDTVKLNTQPGFEYSFDKTNWRSDGIFTGLTPNKTYSFYARPVGSNTLSDPLQVTTDRGTQSKAAAPVIASRTETAVTLQTAVGCEYSMDGNTWQASPVFSGLDPEKSYRFYQRFAQTDTHFAGPASDPVSAEPAGAAEVTSAVYTVKNGIIRKIPGGTDVATLLNGLNGGKYCRVMKGTAQQAASAKVGTGMTVELLGGGKVKAAYTIVVTGDTNGDGQATVTDMIAVKAHLLGKSKLTGAAAQAADTSGDGGITITDFIQIKAKILGKGSITAR